MEQIEEESIAGEADALVMERSDHVATALRDIRSGENIMYRLGGTTARLQVLEDIAFGHKLALVNIAKGELVRKYGEVIGRVTQAIRLGEHVHVHNVEGIRGRGDQAAVEGRI